MFLAANATKKKKKKCTAGPAVEQEPGSKRTASKRDIVIKRQFLPPSPPKATDVLVSMAQHMSEFSLAGGLLANVADHDGEGAELNTFEAGVAKVFGKEDALYFPSGVSANLAGIYAVLAMRKERAAKLDDVERLYLSHHTQISEIQQGTTVAVHFTSDMVHFGDLVDGEAQRENFAALAKLNCPSVNIIPYGRMEVVATFLDVKRILSRTGVGRPAMIVVELPQKMLGGSCMSFGDLGAVRELTRKLGVHLHLDGSRIWEAQPHYAWSLAEICDLFDSVFIDFQKGLGALGGAMLLGGFDMIQESVSWRQRLGALHKSYFPTWFDARNKFDAVQARNPFPERFERLCELVHLLYSKVLPAAESSPVRLWPKVPNASMIHVYIYGNPEDLMQVHAIAEKISGVALFREFIGRGFGNRFAQEGLCKESWQYFEWRMGANHAEITNDELVQAWTVFLDTLQLHNERKEAEEEELRKEEAEATKAANTGRPVDSLVGAPDWWTAPVNDTPFYIKFEQERHIRRKRSGVVAADAAEPKAP
eukprot:gene9533-33185_t